MQSINKIEILCSAILVGLLGSCVGEEPTYEQIVHEELARNIRFDSVAYGVHLGMTYDDFKWHCLLQNRDGLFKPNDSGNAVQLTFEDGFRYPVHFNFFPSDIRGEYEPIQQYDATMRYTAFSTFNENMSMENLVQDTKTFFEDGYGGRPFMAVPNETDPWIKHNFIKIDGNRKINLIPVYMGSELIITIEDLKADSAGR